MDCLTCALLGKFQASFGDKSLPPFRTSKVQALLVYLVVEAIAADGERNQARTSHPREALMELLWPDLHLRAAQDNLRQTLYQLRKAIPDQQSENGEPVRFLESSRLTVGINPAYRFTSDVAEFVGHLRSGELETAVSLYRGDFLANFYLTDSNDFEEWAQVHRNTYRQQAVNALDRLAGQFLELGRYEKVLQVAGQQLVIDDLNESAYRQLMEAQVRLGRRQTALASYETLAQKLEEELGVAPSLETEQLLAQIQKDEIRAADQEPSQPASPQLPPIEEKEAPLFVGRETELGELAAALQKACAGQGGLQLITGGAGRGKTALVSEFATRALAENEELLVLSGQCRGLAGMGEPYLPFRHILAQLTGDVSSSAVLGRGQARRAWEAMPDTIPLVVEQGGELIDALLPGSELRRRAATFSSAQTGWFRRLNERLERPGGGPPQKEQLFSQITVVLKAAARIRPLLLVIEDLHWTDAASAGLLFHLTFELAGSRILVLGTYRPEEVHKGDGHPLARIDSELKRQFGDIWLDLSHKDAVQGRDFIDAYLDSEANELDSRFRRELFAHTGGHALFTVELLRALQERGDLYRDAAGLWQAQPAVDWGALPARVEGVIEQRFGRLDEDLQQALSIAAVQGETFIAGIVAEIQGLDERDLVRRLSREAEKQHRLVEAEGLAWQDGRRLARYRFRHQLFQQYLYGELPEGERIDLHKAVGLQLEALAGDTKALAAELAWHFDQASDDEKALTYLLQAGDAARLLYATEEAVAHYERALAILKARGDNEEAARILMKLGLTHSNAFDFEAAQKAYDESFTIQQQNDKNTNFSKLPSTPQTLRIADEPRSESLDLIYTIVEADYGLFPGLVQYSTELDILPEAASQWEILNGGRTYIFHLRDDIFWSDGRPVTAGDFVYAWKRALEPGHGSSLAENLYDIVGAADYHQGREDCDTSLGFEALDNRTLKVDLVQPVAYFLQVMGHDGAYAVPQHVVDTFGEAWTDPENIVSCGPYMLSTYDEKVMVLVRDPGYYGKFEGNIERLEFHFNKSLAERLRQYAANEVDVCRGRINDAPEFKQEMQQYAGQFWDAAIPETEYYVFDVTKSPFNDPRVRRAFALATDRQQLAIAWGSEPATGGFVPPGMPGHVPNTALPFDLVKARDLLAAAGYPGGKDFPLLNAIIYPGEAKHFPEVVFKCWEDGLGVKIAWKMVAGTEYFETIKKEQPHIYTIGWWADYPDPDNFLRVAVRNYTSWQHETYESLINEARVLGDNSRRLELYRQAEEILVQEAPLVPCCYYYYRILVKPWVKKPHTFLKPQWHKMIIEPHEKPPRPAETEKQRTEPQLSPPPQTLRIAKTPGPESLDLIVDGVDDYGLFPGLVRLSSTLDVVPAAASRWEILNDGRTYLFHLRVDIFWSDGRPVTAGDFVYAWRRALHPAHGSPYAENLYDIVGAAALHQGHQASDSELGFKALDDYTLKVELVEPVAYFLQLMAGFVATAVPRHVVEAVGEAWANPQNIVSSGPYKLHARDADVLVLIRDPNFYEQIEGNVERVEVHLIKSAADILRQYAADEIDICRRITSEALDFNQITEQYAGQLFNTALPRTVYYGFDVSRPPFDDSRMRRAFAHATDRRQSAAWVTEQDPPATGGFVPPGIPGHVPDIALPFDLDKARELLTAAGYPDGKDLPPLSAITLGFPEEVFKCWEDELGVKISRRKVAWTEYFETIQREKPHIHTIGWRPDYPDPDNFLRVAVHKMIPWRHKIYESLISEARVLGDKERRLELYRQAEEILVQEAPLVPWRYYYLRNLVKPWVKNPHTFLWPQWHKVIIEPHDEEKIKLEESISMPEPQPENILRVPCFEGDFGLGLDLSKLGVEDVGLFPGLVQLTSELAVEPDAARYWEILENGRLYRFHLRDDVYWSDEKPVTAADFVYAWRRILDPSQGVEFASLLYDIAGAADYHQNQGLESELGFRALDNCTLEIELEEPKAYFLQILCQPVATAVPRHVVEQYGEHWADADHIVSCGPYKVHSLDNEIMILCRDPLYHGRYEGNVQRVEIRTYASFDNTLASYHKQELDVVGFTPYSLQESNEPIPENLDEYRSGSRYGVDTVFFDVTQKPFDDPRVRRAFALATDKQRIAAASGLVKDIPATGGFVPPGIPGHIPGIALPFDPQEARRLLAEAGFPGGSGFPTIQIDLTRYAVPLTLEQLLNPWQEILGVKFDPRVLDWDDYFEMVRRNRPAIENLPWMADYPDPDSFLRICIRTSTSWQYEKYDALIEEARISLDHNQRLDLFRQAEEILVHEAPLIPLLYKNYHVFIKPWVKNYQDNTIFRPQWHKVIIEPH